MLGLLVSPPITGSTDQIDVMGAGYFGCAAMGPEAAVTGTFARLDLMGRIDLEGRIRAICLALPGVTERRSHGAPGFFAGKQFVMLWPSGHHDHDFPHMWCAAPPGAQDELVTTEPDRFFRPPYVGGRGWIGIRLDGDVDWGELTAVCEDAFRAVATNKPDAELDRAQG